MHRDPKAPELVSLETEYRYEEKEFEVLDDDGNPLHGEDNEREI